GLFAGVANSLLLFRCLRRSSNHCSGNSKASPPVRQRTHAFTGCIFSRETRGKLSRTPHGESAARGFDMRRPRPQLLHTINFPVHALQCAGEYLLALQGMFCDARKALAPRPSLATRFAALRARQGALLVAHLTQALAQHLEVIKSGVINFRMVTTQD